MVNERNLILNATKTSTTRTCCTRLTQARTFIALTVLCITPVYAYIDPGTGSILLQGLLAGVASVIAFGGIFWKRVHSFISSIFPERSKKNKDHEIDHR